MVTGFVVGAGRGRGGGGGGGGGGRSATDGHVCGRRGSAIVRGSRRLVVRSLIFTSKQMKEDDVTTVVISGKDRRGHLLSVSRVLDEKEYTIVRGYVSSARGSVNDSFTISKDGRSLTSEELVEVSGPCATAGGLGKGPSGHSGVQ